MKTLLSQVFVALAGFALAALTIPAAQAANPAAQLVPVQTTPEGRSYGHWAVEWWQWALGIPAAVNPVLDTSGEHCEERQVGNVWFLAGAFSGATIERECTVPPGKSLFFPLINNLWGAFLNDAPEDRTEAFIREQSRCVEPELLDVTLNGKRIPKPQRFFVGEGGQFAPLFNVQLPPGAVFGLDENIVPELVLSPSAQEGYYLFLKPLPPGEYTLSWNAVGCTFDINGNPHEQHIIYYLTIGEKSQ